MDSSFLFPQMLRWEEQDQSWTPHFVDYLFLAFNTSTAFSPTDTAVLSRQAKLGMMVQSLVSLTIICPACRASCEHSLSCTLAALHDFPGTGPRGRFVSPVAIRAAKSARTGSYESSAVCRLNFRPECFFTAAFMATLTFPDVLTTGARDRLRGKFLFQRLSTNWTISAPHIHTCLSLTLAT
jgi:hypothetical protein